VARTTERRGGRVSARGAGFFLVMLLATSTIGIGVALAAGLNLASAKLTTYRSCTITASPSSTTAVADTYVNQASANANSGTAATMNVRSNVLANRRIYIRFDLTACSPAIPSSASVKASTLRLYVTALPASCRTVDLFRVTASWTETGITWNNQPFGTSTNNPPSSQRTSAISIGAAACQNSSTGVYVSGWDVSSDVQAFVSGRAANYGWMIRDDIEDAAISQSAAFSTKNANVVAQAPQLVVTYQVSP
jgi:hypothetical protein